ncbi:MAG TPA: methylated-DNA--[protein]-cysteine S-methyltransferase [Rhizomicrobium sp.]|nr:methylated-DNA--[protein]-cysteine S-methyltransferase [Rhizomicrobium sp.]
MRSNRAAGGRAPSYIGVVMSGSGFALFETAIGHCGIVWSERGIVGVQLPEGGAHATRSRVLRRFPAAREVVPPAEIQRVIDDVIVSLAGEPQDLSRVQLDTGAVTDFQRRVYDIARTITAGSTLSYGEIAERLGDRQLARDVGEALGQNPFPIIVPCHRVMAAGGKMGGFSAPGGVRTKLRLLSIEGTQPGGPTLFGNLPLATAPRRRT